MKDFKNKIEMIIEKSSGKKSCSNCSSYKDGYCMFNCVNERNGYAYNFSNKKRTISDYSCDNFNSVYNFNESTLDALRDLLEDIDRVNEGKRNLELLLDNKINEEDFVEIIK